MNDDLNERACKNAQYGKRLIILKEEAGAPHETNVDTAPQKARPKKVKSKKKDADFVFSPFEEEVSDIAISIDRKNFVSD